MRPNPDSNRKRLLLVTLVGLVLAGGIVLGCCAILGLFLRGPSADVEGEMWDAGEASEHLAHRGVVGHTPVHAPDRTLAEVIWEGREGTVEIRHHATAEAARAEAARVGGTLGVGCRSPSWRATNGASLESAPSYGSRPESDLIQSK